MWSLWACETITASSARGSNESWRLGLLGSIRSESNNPQSSRDRLEPISRRWALPVICRVAPWNVIRNQHPPDEQTITRSATESDRLGARRRLDFIPEPGQCDSGPQAAGHGPVSNTFLFE